MAPGRKHPMAEVHRDANEEALLKVAAMLGVAVWLGPPLDGWALFRGRWFPIEIKMPEREGTQNEYTPAQQRFLRWCQDHNSPVYTWRTNQDVIAFAGGRVGA